MRRMIFPLIGFLLLMSSSAHAEDGHFVVYDGGTEAEVTAALSRFGISGELEFESIDALEFPDPDGLWVVGPTDMWDCTSPMGTREIKDLIDQAIDATFETKYEIATQLIDQTMGYLACEPIDSLIGRAMFVRGIIECNSGQHIGDTIYGDSNRAMNFFMYANAADLALEWDVSFPPTCEVIGIGGRKETWEAKSNFDFAKEKVQEAVIDKAMRVPVNQLVGDLEITIDANGSVPTPSMVSISWKIEEESHSRIVMLGIYQALTVVAEQPWRGILLAGPIEDTPNEEVVKATFNGRGEFAIDVVRIHDDKSVSVYTYYSNSSEVPFYVHPRKYPRSHDKPKQLFAPGALGLAGSYTLVGTSNYFGGKLFGRIQIVKGLQIALGGFVGVTSYKEYVFILPSVDLGVRYQFAIKRARPFIGAQALVTFTNDPERPLIHVAGLICGGISLEVSEHILAPFVEACGGGGTLTGIVQLSVGVAFQ